MEPGTDIDGRYRIVRPLGAGGMGGVFEIEGIPLGNRLALKLIHTEYAADPSILARFEREARIQARLQHDGVARVFDITKVDGRLGIVMEYISGPTLRSWQDGRRLDPELVRQILAELLGALVAAHAENVVHRDLKPDNIFVLTDDAGRIRCKLIDFGIAKLRSDVALTAATKGLTRGGDFVGTYRYASPEQVEQSSSVDHRSDLYTVGVIAWELLAGTAPYPATLTPFKVQVAVVNEPLPELPGDVPDDLRALVSELTRKDPGERPQSAQEVLKRLQAPRLDAGSATVAGPRSLPSDPTAKSTAGSPSGTQPAERVDPTVVLPESAPPDEDAPDEAAGGSRAPNTEELPGSDGADAGVTAAPPQAPAQRKRSPPGGSDLLLARLLARLLDELVPMFMVLACFTAPIYPVMALQRCRRGVPSMGQRVTGTRLLDARTGEPAADDQVFARNMLDLMLFQAPLALGIWPIFSFSTYFLSVMLAVVWVAFLVCIEFGVAASNPGGRRLVDMMCGTRVARAT